jgi:TPR repeat protein
MFKRLALALVLALLVALPATAQDYLKGFRAFKRGDYAAALKEWRPLAEHGHLKAQNRLGNMYAGGFGVPQDYIKAVKWYRKAAYRGNALAQNGLGMMFVMGRGVPQDYVEAAKWFRKAAEQGNARAQHSLGKMYLSDRYIKQDFILAHMWFSLASSRRLKITMESLDRLTKHMTRAQIAEAQKLAREWRAKHKKR